MSNKNRILFIIVPCIVALSILGFAILANTNSNATSDTNTAYKGVKREYWISDTDIPGFNETKMGMPRDVFSMSSITVNKGDTIVIHFFNIEEPGGDNHSFTIWDKPYNINEVIHPGENKTITFDATTPGIFTYLCTFHQPTMRGQLIVLTPESQ